MTGIGVAKSAQLWYRVMLGITSGGDYEDLGLLLGTTCRRLVGFAGFTLADCVEVDDAVAATEMVTVHAPGTLEASMCPTAGQPTQDVMFDDMETGAGRWQLSKARRSCRTHSYPYGGRTRASAPMYLPTDVSRLEPDDPDLRPAGRPTSGWPITRSPGLPVSRSRRAPRRSTSRARGTASAPGPAGGRTTSPPGTSRPGSSSRRTSPAARSACGSSSTRLPAAQRSWSGWSTTYGSTSASTGSGRCATWPRHATRTARARPCPGNRRCSPAPAWPATRSRSRPRWPDTRGPSPARPRPTRWPG